MGSYSYPKFTYKSVADLLTQAPQHKPLVIVGAGPVGLAAAIDARSPAVAVMRHVATFVKKLQITHCAAVANVQSASFWQVI